MVFSSFSAAVSRSIFACRSTDATMFWISISGSCFMRNPSLFRSLTTVCTAFIDSCSLLAPVQTIFPDEKIRVAVLGFASLNTSPGNWAGLYSVSGNALWIWVRSRVWFMVTEATTFSILMVGSGVLLILSTFISPLYIMDGGL